MCETYGWAKRSMKFQQQQIMELFSNNVVENDRPFLGLETAKPNKCDPIKDGTGGEKGNNNNNNKTSQRYSHQKQFCQICPCRNTCESAQLSIVPTSRRGTFGISQGSASRVENTTTAINGQHEDIKHRLSRYLRSCHLPIFLRSGQPSTFENH